MKMKRISTFFALLLTTIFVGCEAEYQPYDNAVYLSEARTSTSTKVIIDNLGGKGVFSARLSKTIGNDVKVKFGIDPAALTTFNTINGGDYHLLPPEYYTLSANKGVIKAGKIGCEPVTVNIKPFDENIDQNKKYAIPIALESASGCDVLSGARRLVILIDQVIVTNAIHIDYNTQVPRAVFETPQNFGAWTLEWLINQDHFTRNNVTQWVVKDTAGKQIVYTRFGDVTCPTNHYQFNLGSGKFNSAGGLSPHKWYHMALVYDGANVMLYINGALDVKSGHGKPGELFEFASVNFSNNVRSQFALHGGVCEMRVWSVARSQNEIANNMYTVDPTTEGLEVYWKANEGEGSVLKDYSGHGRDGIMAQEPSWLLGLRFPEGM